MRRYSAEESPTRRELSDEEALLAARLPQSAEVDSRLLLETPTTRIAIDLDHPAYECLYLALAAESAIASW